MNAMIQIDIPLAVIPTIVDLAARRRANAIDELVNGPQQLTQEQAEARNWPANHIQGVSAEYAVIHWLEAAGVKPKRNFENVMADFQGAADIEISEPALFIDVKATERRRYPSNQASSLERKNIVVWCEAFPTPLSKPKEVYVEIRGWTWTRDIKMPPDGTDFFASDAVVHDPTKLFEALRLAK